TLSRCRSQRETSAVPSRSASLPSCIADWYSKRPNRTCHSTAWSQSSLPPLPLSRPRLRWENGLQRLAPAVAQPRSRLTLLAEGLGEHAEHLGPGVLGAARVVRPVRMQLMGQGELGPRLAGLDVDRHAAQVRRVLRDPPGEGEAAWPVDLQVLADVVDLFALTADDEGER